MLHSNVHQLYLNSLATREEMIFLLRIITHQLFCENVSQKNLIAIIREIFQEIMKSEKKRELIENQCMHNLSDLARKDIQKTLQKYLKISNFYLSKTQVFTYYPKYGQILAQEYLPSNSMIKSTVIAQLNDTNYTGSMILRFLSNKQKEKLKQELQKLNYFASSYQVVFEMYHQFSFSIDRSDRCLRNEKFFSDPLIIGAQGITYLNSIHEHYFFQSFSKNNRMVYDILHLDDQSKQLLYVGGGKPALIINIKGFRSYITSMQIQKKDRQQEQSQSIYIPIETTQEIITQRYEKMEKEMFDNNYKVNKSIKKYIDRYQKYLLKIKKPKIASGQSLCQEQFGYSISIPNEILLNRRSTSNINIKNPMEKSQPQHSISQLILHPDMESQQSSKNDIDLAIRNQNIESLRKAENQLAQMYCSPATKKSFNSNNKIVRLKFASPPYSEHQTEEISLNNKRREVTVGSILDLNKQNTPKFETFSPFIKEMMEQYQMNRTNDRQLTIVTLPIQKNQREDDRNQKQIKRPRYYQLQKAEIKSLANPVLMPNIYVNQNRTQWKQCPEAQDRLNGYISIERYQKYAIL